MNKLLYFILFFASLGTNAQVRPKVYVPNTTTRNTAIARGGFRSDSTMGVPNRDTTYVPERSGDMVFRPADGLFYIYLNGQWYPFQNFVKNIYVTNGLTALNDSTIGYGGRLSKNDTTSGRGTFGLLYDSLSSFVIRGPTNAIAPDASALFEVLSTTRGVVFAKMTTAQMNAITSPTAGLLVFNTDSTSYFEYTGAAWQNVRGGGGGGSTPGLDAVLAVNQNLSANRISNFVGFNWEIDGNSNTAPTFHVVQSGTNPAIWATATTTGSTGIRSVVANGNSFDATATSGTAFNGTITTGNGFFISLTDGVGGIFQSNSTTTNQVQQLLFLEHGTQGTAAPGIGSAITWANEDASGGLSADGQITETLYTTTAGNKGSNLNIILTTANVLAQVVTIDGIGGVQSVGTGAGGTFSGPTAGANVISTATGTGGIPLNIINKTTNTNSVVNGIYLERQGGAGVTGATGEGIGIWSNMVDAGGSVFNSGKINFEATSTTVGVGNQITDLVVRLAIASNGETEVLRVKGSTKSLFFTQVSLIANFANNAAALSGGLTTGDVYRNGDVLQVVH